MELIDEHLLRILLPGDTYRHSFIRHYRACHKAYNQSKHGLGAKMVLSWCNSSGWYNVMANEQFLSVISSGQVAGWNSVDSSAHIRERALRRSFHIILRAYVRILRILCMRARHANISRPSLYDRLWVTEIADSQISHRYRITPRIIPAIE